MLAVGNYIGIPEAVSIAKNYKDERAVFVKVRIVDGESEGQTMVYDGALEGDRIKFTKRDLVAFGWKGQSSATVHDDILGAAKRVPFRVEHMKYTKPDKNGNDRFFAVMRDIGRAEMPEHIALSADQINALDDALAAADNDPFGYPEPDAPAPF